MIKEYDKGYAIKLSERFQSTQFDCKCKNPTCDYTLIDTDLIEGLEEAWDRVGEIIIESGFRCHAHNKYVGGKPGSYHLVGKAADIKPVKVSVNTLWLTVGSIGVFENGAIGRANTFLHVDNRGYAVRFSYK